MLLRFVDTMVNYLIKNGAPESEREIYVYGLTCSLGEILGNLVLLACALFLHQVPEMLLWIFVFDVLRVNIGGYHAQSPGRCLLGGTILGIAGILIYPIFYNHIFLVISAILSAIGIIFKIAPITNKNHPVSERKKRSARKWAISLSIFFGIFILIIYSTNMHISSVMLSGLLSVSMLGLYGYLV